ncbi:YceI family protein [Lichenicoccus sp.]|uniref:YceI family protein n=1 Tax=Lichenicoccus sp. TaxID=2781899 RepID=UPI003D0F3931
MLAVLLAVSGAARAAEPFPAGLYKLDPLHSRIAWSVSHLGFSIYRGLIPSVQGSLRIDPADPAASRLNAYVAMAGLSSLDPALDTRLRGPQFFATGRYPVAAYHADGLTMTGPHTARLDGTLTLVGVTHRLAMNVRFERAGRDPVTGKLTLGFEGTATLQRSRYGIVAYTPLVGNDVALELEAEFVLQ